MPCKSPFKPSWGQQSTVASLSATMSLLARQGFGRLVMASFDSEDSLFVRTAVRLLRDESLWAPTNKTKAESSDFDWNRTIHSAFQEEEDKNTTADSTASSSLVSRLGTTEIGFVNVIRPKKKYSKNVPRATLMGLSNAFKGESSASEAELWLGPRSRGPSFWRYVYLTEADTILQTRRSNLPDFKEKLDSGLLLLPHRLQVIPHESDLRGYKDRRKYLPSLGPLEQVRTLDASLNGGASCCGLGLKRPCKFVVNRSLGCTNTWYLNGTHKRETNDQLLQRHSLLWNYSLVSLKQGVGLVTLAASNFGRQCLPSDNTNCGIGNDHRQ